MVPPTSQELADPQVQDAPRRATKSPRRRHVADVLKNDPEFWLDAGIDISHRTWREPSLTLDELKEFGRIHLQEGPRDSELQALYLERQHPDLAARRIPPGRSV